jgi:hypothetical protein
MSDQVSAVRARVEQAISEVLFKHGFLRGDGIIAQLVEAALRAAPAGVTAPIDPIYFMSKMLEGLAAGDADKSLAYARHYIEQLEASGSASQAKRLRDAMDGTARMVGLAAPAGAHCNDCTDPHCHGAAPAVSREASVPQVGELERVRLRLIALWGDPEDCEDCAVIESRPCRVHANWENGE